MKKWGFFVFIVMLLGYAAIITAPTVREFLSRDHEVQVVTSNSAGRIDIVKDQVYQGDLLLVNKEHPVRQDSVPSDIVHLFQEKDLVKGYGLLDTNIRLSESLAHTFGKMVQAAEKEGVRHFLISSGYRDFEEQDKLYREKGSDYALPAGYSEHNLGLSLDIGSTESEMSKAAEGKWLKKNAWKYGFILRYPEDRTEITGIRYEPWHFRYVGLPHSAIMQKNNLVLEQYSAYLKEHKNISTVVGSKTYEVVYYPVAGNTTLTLPENRGYEISGNNVDGVIVTLLK